MQEERITYENIRVTKDEDLNDLFYIWQLFNVRPCKVGLYTNFDTDEIWNKIYSSNYTVTSSNIIRNTESIIEGEYLISSTKYCIELLDNIYICLYEYTSELLNETHTSNLVIYYNNKFITPEYIDTILDDFSDCIIGDITENTEDNTYKSSNIVHNLHLASNNIYELKPIELNESPSIKDMKLMYNKNVLSSMDKFVKDINENNKGISIITGERGTGKTTSINYLINKIKKNIIYVPSYLIEHTFTNLEFQTFLMSNPNSVVIFDDCEHYFDKSLQVVNLYVTNLLQLIDGLFSDIMNINIVLVMNKLEKDIDTNLKLSNNFLNSIEYTSLEPSIANKLSKDLGFNNVYKNPTKLIDVYKNRGTVKSKFL